MPRVHGYGRPDIRVDDAIEQLPGSPVCLSGAVGKLQCGHIVAGETSYRDAFGGVISKAKITDTCSREGDSGGPVISGNHAQGIFVSGNRAASSCGLISGIFATSLYIPLSRALGAFSSFGLSLLTTPAPVTCRPSRASRGPTTTPTGPGSAVRSEARSSRFRWARPVQAFGRGTDNRLYTNIFADGAWGGWQSLGAADALTEPPTVLACAGGIDVYYRGVDTRPYLRRFNGSPWEPPVKLGEIDVEGQIVAVNAQLDHVILFIRSSDDEVYYNFTDGVAPWSAGSGSAAGPTPHPPRSPGAMPPARSCWRCTRGGRTTTSGCAGSTRLAARLAALARTWAASSRTPRSG